MESIRDNWDIIEIDYNKYESLKTKILAINISNNAPKQYLYLFEHKTGFELLIEQTFVGLRTLPYISFANCNHALICFTNCCLMIDYESQNIVFKKELLTPCIDIILINDNVYMVCEAEILKYSVSSNLWDDYLSLTDSVKDIFNVNGNWFVVLYNGETICLSL